MIVSVDKETEVLAQLVMAAFDGGVVDGAVYPLDLAAGSRMVGLCQAVLDAVFTTDLVEAMDPVAGGWAVPVVSEVGELDALAVRTVE